MPEFQSEGIMALNHPNQLLYGVGKRWFVPWRHEREVNVLF
jgi:hypothetical protein